MIVYIAIACAACLIIFGIYRDTRPNLNGHAFARFGARTLIYFTLLGLSFFIFPWIAFVMQAFHLGILTGIFYLWDQALLPTGFMLTKSGTNYNVTYFHQRWILYLGILFWLANGILYVWLTRRLKIRYVILLVYPAILIAAIVVYTALDILFGLNPMVEAP